MKLCGNRLYFVFNNPIIMKIIYFISNLQESIVLVSQYIVYIYEIYEGVPFYKIYGIIVKLNVERNLLCMSASHISSSCLHTHLHKFIIHGGTLINILTL